MQGRPSATGTSALSCGARRSILFAFALLAAFPAHAATRPAAPLILEPQRDNQYVNGADVHMVTALMADADGDEHLCTDWQITLIGHEVWQAPCATGPSRVHIHLGDGLFTGDLDGARELQSGRVYKLRVRHRDDSGDAATEWSEWSERVFATTFPSPTLPMNVSDVLPAPAPVWTIEPQNGASLWIELADGQRMMELLSSGLLDEEPAGARGAIRVGMRSGDEAWDVPASELSFSDEDIASKTIYLPAVSLAPRSSVLYWVSANGSTHPAREEDRAPSFEATVRPSPIPWHALERGFVIERVASGFRLPVNIAFVADPKDDPDSAFFYVAELYGDVKVVTRSGEVRDFVSNLLDFDPGGNIPGDGETGLAGITVDSVSGDVFVTYVSGANRVNGERIANIARLAASQDGLRMTAIEPVLVLADAKQSASHQISNITIGPDRKLYVHVGDGLWDPSARDLSLFRGKILRMDMDGTASPDNPYYDATDGITARDYIFASGFRNPFGGAWRAAVQALYEIENGPQTDRLARVVRGLDYGWDGTDQSMRNYSICGWSAPAAPVQIAWVQQETFGGSGFPERKFDTAYVTESGPTWGSARQAVGKRISEVVLDGDELVRGPVPFVEYDGTGKATAVALAAGPDGLYFSDLYKDFDFQSPVDRGANVYRVRWAGYAEFGARTFTPDGLGVRFTNGSDVPDATTWRWDFGDGQSSSERNAAHHYAEEGSYIVRLTANGTVTTAKRVVVHKSGTLMNGRFTP